MRTSDAYSFIRTLLELADVRIWLGVVLKGKTYSEGNEFWLEYKESLFVAIVSG